MRFIKTKLKALIKILAPKNKAEKPFPKKVLHRSQKLMETYNTNVDDFLDLLNTSRDGLTIEEAELRLDRVGLNEIAHEKVPTWYVELFRAFLNPFIAILMVLGIISLITDVLIAKPDERSWKTVILLSFMILLSAMIRFWQEFKSTRAAEKLKEMITTSATVVRKGLANSIEIPIAHLVPGDIVKLSAGDMIPADVCLLTSKDLFVSQAILTGESNPIEKFETYGKPIKKGHEEPTSLFDYSQICLMGTSVVSGTGIAAVIATANQTYLGSIAKSVVQKRILNSFDKGINRISWLLIYFMAVMVPIVFFLNGFTKGDWLEAFLFAISVAVGLTPEMLPTVVTANLAKGAIAMSRRKTIVKRLNAIQNFGAMNILCTDKTGTLTQNKIILMYYLDAFGQKDSQRVLKFGFLNSFHQTGLKNLLDVAILDFVKENEMAKIITTYEKFDEIPFDFERRRMSVVLKDGNHHHILICKGAPDEIVDICAYYEDQGKIKPLSQKVRDNVFQLVNELSEEGFRVIAIAHKSLEAEDRPYNARDESGLTLVGYMAFLDPPKETVKEAIESLYRNGVGVKIITGDNEIVTRKICKEVGLTVDNVLLGSDIEKLSDRDLAHIAERTTIFAKISPLQKSQIVKALQSQGNIIGYLGDGINDAPALRHADVGISVDTAVDIARESADIILLDKDLMVLEEGIIEGRKTFGNIIKYIKMTTSSNFGNVFSVLVASSFLPFLPMLPLQLLLQNMLYDISQTSIPWDNVDKEYLAVPRKWDASSIAKFMLFIGPTSSIFDIVTFLVMWNVFLANSIEHQALFQSGWFVVGLITQTLIVHMIRTQKVPFLQSIASMPVILMTSFIILIGIILPNSFLGPQLGLVPLPLSYYLWLFGIVLSYCTLTQIVKNWYIRKFHQWL